MIIAIDPGQTGCIAWYFDGKIKFQKMPDTEEGIVELIRSIVDENTTAKLSSPICYLEQVHAMPGQGVSSTFTFGQGYGFLRGVLLTLDIPVVDVSPQKWMKTIGVPKFKEKKDRKHWILNYVKNRLSNEKVFLYHADGLGILFHAIDSIKIHK